MDIILIGSRGRMGQAVIDACPNDVQIVKYVDRHNIKEFLDDNTKIADVIVDFSNRSLTAPLSDYAIKTHTPLLIATTGQTEEQMSIIENTARYVPIFKSGNLSLGICLLLRSIKSIIKAFPNAEVDIIECHHRQKLDMPSGTALLLAECIARFNDGRVVYKSQCSPRNNKEIVIHSIRHGLEIGKHIISFSTDNETITLTHSALNRKAFADGAFVACRFLVKTQVGLYGLEDLLNESKL